MDDPRALAGRPGDQGLTSLADGRQVAKHDPRIACLGSLDELSATLGLLRVALAPNLPDAAAWVRSIQQDLLMLGGELAMESPVGSPAHSDSGPDPAHPVEPAPFPEPPAHCQPAGFMLPGANEGEARAHLARTVCRRAERELVALASAHPVPAGALPYLNRLSVRLFSLACRLGKA